MKLIWILFATMVVACLPGRKTPEEKAEPAPKAELSAEPLPRTRTVITAVPPVSGPECDPFADYKGEKIFRATEAAYPSGRAFSAAPRTFSDLVDKQTVERAVKQYACRNRLYEKDDQVSSVLWGHDLSLEGASYYARMQAFVHAGIDSLMPKAGLYFEVSEQARVPVRQHLRDPKNLKREYTTYKPILVNGLRHAQNPQKIKAYLGSILPIFTQPIPPDVLAAETVFRGFEERLVETRDPPDAIVEATELRRQELLKLMPDYRVLQWMLRRQSEGGEPLVRAWGEVLSDLHKSL